MPTALSTRKASSRTLIARVTVPSSLATAEECPEQPEETATLLGRRRAAGAGSGVLQPAKEAAQVTQARDLRRLRRGSGGADPWTERVGRHQRAQLGEQRVVQLLARGRERRGHADLHGARDVGAVAEPTGPEQLV